MESCEQESVKVSNENVAASLRCDDCGKLFQSATDAQLHAEKTEHQDFSESTETIRLLTHEEKQAKIQQLRERLAAKRAAQAVLDQENVRRNALIERKKTKETSDIMDSLKRKEQLRDIEKKKKEKQEDIAAKVKVRAQIEADKKDRSVKGLGVTSPEISKLMNPNLDQQAFSPAFAKTKMTHDSTRLQLRMVGQQAIIRQFASSMTLYDVAKELESETGIDPHFAVFRMTFPTRVFQGDDLRMDLKGCSLTPSATLTLSAA